MKDTATTPPTPNRVALVRRLPALRIEHLWALAALTLISGFVALVPTVPNDFWWHLAVGRIIAREGLPYTNLFAWSLPTDTPYIYQSWLSEWLFYVLYAIGGFPLVVFIRNLLFTMTFGLCGYDAYRRSGSWRLAALAIVLAGAMSMNNLTTRTQNWSLLPFVLTSLLLHGYVEGRVERRMLWLLPAIMIFWVNAHGAFVNGLLLIGAYLAGELVRRLLRQSRALTWERLKDLAFVAVGTLLAIFVNPQGFGIVGYVNLLLSNPSSQNLINEWQPPSPRTLAGGAFFIAVLVLVAAFGLGRRRPSITDVLLACGFGWMAFSASRHVIWFALVAMPLVAQSLAAPRSALASERKAIFPIANAFVAVLLLVLLLMLQPWFKYTLPWPEPYRALFVDLPDGQQLFSSNTPVAAAEYLKTEPCSGHLFNEMGQGSYLIWALYPMTQVFIDTRIELYPSEQWQDYIALSEGRDLDRLLVTKYDVACVLLDRQGQPELSAALARDGSWSRTFSDAHAEIWRR